MFRGRDEQFAEDLAAELQPYQNTAADYEAEERLRAFDAELTLAGRHLLNSNDRYQMSAAHLVMARNQFLVASTVTSSLIEVGAQEYRRGPDFDRERVVGFLKNTFQASRLNLETADSIASQPGYRAESDHVDSLRQAATVMQWPGISSVSTRFVRGTVDAADKINGYTATAHYALEAAPNLLPGYKPHLDRSVQPLFVSADSHRKSIERVMGSGILQRTSEGAVVEVYDDAQVVIGALNRISLYLTYPQMFDASLRVRNPIHEDRPGQRSFNPAILGAAPTPPPPRPSRPAVTPKPFSADVLPPAPKSGPAEPTPARPFDPSVLGPAPRTPEQAPVEVPQERPFDPSILNRPGTSTPVSTEHPFDPSILGRPNLPPAQARPFDPSILDRKTDKAEE